MLAWRITKTRHPPFDGTGARRHGARWNPPGFAVVYAADSFAGALLEILVHAARPRTLPGAHHGVEIRIPDELVEWPRDDALGRWAERDSAAAAAFGERWLREARTVALAVPSLPARPVGKTVLINPAHPDATRISVGAPFPVPWDERLF